MTENADDAGTTLKGQFSWGPVTLWEIQCCFLVQVYVSAKEKGKFEDMAKVDKAHYKREMKTYIHPKEETKKKFKDPHAPKRPPLAFFLFCSAYHPKIKGEHPGLSTGDIAKKLRETWNDNKQPYEKKTAKLKEKYRKVIAAYQAKEKPDVAIKEVVKAKKSKKKEEEEDEEDEEDDGEEENEEDNDEDDDDDYDEVAIQVVKPS
ncbi:high mobility group protein B1-like [Choloepus didactylus]|uniref:high mobility group protein B1-like n=1 Tax=Choloepus didactylus TaxID=27675 RepID=UPI00189D5EE4|nr:high mobility group protein B1-like [Choloepus didactylus]